MDNEKRMYVLRVQGKIGDLCDICIEWEELVNSQGGMEFGEEDIKKSENPQYGRTHLFHPNCRCRLVPTAGGQPIRDDIDRKVVFAGAIGHAHYGKMSKEERIRMVVDHDV